MKEKEENNFDRKKAIADMQNLKAKVIGEIKADMLAKGQTEIDEERLNDMVTIKYLGKIGLANEQGELIESDWYAAIEQIGGQLQIIYYDENQNILGKQIGMDGDIIPTEDALIETKKGFEKPKEMEELQQEDIEKAKTLEELEEEQRRVEQNKKQEGPQLTKKQVESLGGPKIDLNQQVDNMTLAQKIELDGTHIKFVSIDEAKKLIPDLELDELGQQFIPLEIYSNGTANVIGEDKLKYSTLEGSNNTNEQTTMNNDGSRKQEQGIVTFDIAGTRNCITVGFDELNTSSPFYEAKFGTRDVEQPSEVLYDELETVYEGPLKQEKEKAFAQMNNTEGMYEASREIVTEEQAERFAKASGWYVFDKNGNVAGPDIEKATVYLKENSIGDNSVEELIEQANDGAKTRGPENPYMNE